MKRDSISDEKLKEIIIAEANAMAEALPDPKDVQPHEFSPEFEENMRKLIDDTKQQKH